MRLVLKAFGKRMHEADIREKLPAMHKNVHAVMQLRSQQRDQDAEKDRPCHRTS